MNHLISRKLRSHHVMRYDVPCTGHNSINDGRNFSAGTNRVYTDPWLKAYAVSSQKTIDASYAGRVQIRIEMYNKVCDRTPSLAYSCWIGPVFADADTGKGRERPRMAITDEAET